MLKICRTCLTEIEDVNFVDLENVKTELSNCVPEMDLDLISDPFLCTACVTVLHSAFNFKTQCLYNEERIRNCLQSIKLDGSKVSLAELCLEINGSTGNCNSIEVKKIIVKPPTTATDLINAHNVCESASCSLQAQNETLKYEDKDALNAKQCEIKYEIFKNENTVSVEECEIKDECVDKTTHTLPHFDKNNTEIEEYFVEFLEVPDEANSCNIRENQTASPKLLAQHLKTHSNKKPFACSICEYSTAHKSCLMRHMKIHTSEKLHTCNICYHKFVTKSDLARHIRIHSAEKPYRCNSCNYCTTRKDNLNSHERTHTGEKPFVCSTCNISFTNRKSLLAHSTVHDSNAALKKALSCTMCEFTTIHKNSMEHHLRIHTGEKPFVCKVCDFRFRKKTNLDRHMKLHIGKKIFACNLCDFNSASNKDLITHKILHSKESFTCNTCGFTTTYKNCLARHMIVHSNEKPFVCNMCEFRTAHKNVFKKHAKVHASNKSEYKQHQKIICE